MKSLSKLLPIILVMSCEGGRFKSSAASDTAPATAADAIAEAPKPEEPAVILPTDPVVTPTPTPVVDDGTIFKECNGNPDLPYIADLYQLAPDAPQLPDFTTIKPIKQICIRQLSIATRDFKEGFPGVEGLIEWFALSIKVKLTVPADGDYTLSVNSDDGSKLYLNNELVIDNDRQHSTKEVSAIKTLKAGVYDARIDYFQGPRFHIALELFWQPPGQAAKSYIPATYLKRP